MKLTQSLLLGIASLPVIYGAAIPAAPEAQADAAAAKYDSYEIPKGGYGKYSEYQAPPPNYVTYARRKREAEAKAKALHSSGDGQPQPDMPVYEWYNREAAAKAAAVKRDFQAAAEGAKKASETEVAKRAAVAEAKAATPEPYGEYSDYVTYPYDSYNYEEYPTKSKREAQGGEYDAYDFTDYKSYDGKAKREADNSQLGYYDYPGKPSNYYKNYDSYYEEYPTKSKREAQGGEYDAYDFTDYKSYDGKAKRETEAEAQPDFVDYGDYFEDYSDYCPECTQKSKRGAQGTDYEDYGSFEDYDHYGNFDEYSAVKAKRATDFADYDTYDPKVNPFQYYKSYAEKAKREAANGQTFDVVYRKRAAQDGRHGDHHGGPPKHVDYDPHYSDYDPEFYMSYNPEYQAYAEKARRSAVPDYFPKDYTDYKPMYISYENIYAYAEDDKREAQPAAAPQDKKAKREAEADEDPDYDSYSSFEDYDEYKKSKRGAEPKDENPGEYFQTDNWSYDEKKVTRGAEAEAAPMATPDEEFIDYDIYGFDDNIEYADKSAEKRDMLEAIARAARRNRRARARSSRL